jgi:hypothetical protein
MPGNRTLDCQRKPLRVDPLYILDSGKPFELILVIIPTTKNIYWLVNYSDLDVVILGSCDDVAVLLVPRGPRGQAHDGRLIPACSVMHQFLSCTALPGVTIYRMNR